MNQTRLYDGRILSLVIQDNKWEIIEHAEAVAILVIQNNQVLGVMQPRPAINQTTWEIPAGLIDDGETPLEAAQRELAEEVQMGGDLTLITQVYSSPGFTNEKIYIFEASNLVSAYAKPDSDENITLSWRDPKEIWDDIRTGKIASSTPTALALHYALHNANR
jgi:ADP-ribose pyrophosphatase